MTYNSLLVNLCNILAWESIRDDDYGQPEKTWPIKVVDGISYENIPCRHVSGKGREIKVGQEVHIIYDELYIGNIDVIVQDRVFMDSETYEVVDVLFSQDGIGNHHKKLFLEIVK